MKKYLALLLFALITAVSFGQSNYQDVVYLKNGSIIRGVIIEQVPNKSIKIETADRSVFVYQMDEIEKLTKEPIQGKSGGSFSNSGLQSGYKGIVELGYQIGTGGYGMDRLKLNIINGYQINPYFSLGFGTGLRYYFDEKVPLIPVFADFRANFIDNKISPYLSLGVGYSFNASDSFKGVGFLLNPKIGVSFKVSKKSAINFGLGYEMQRVITKNSGAIDINVGISF
jgi:hypothetical protein